MSANRPRQQGAQLNTEAGSRSRKWKLRDWYWVALLLSAGAFVAMLLLALRAG